MNYKTLFIFLFVSSIIFSIATASAAPQFFYGKVNISTNSTTTGAVIKATTNETITVNTLVGQATCAGINPCYGLTIPCNNSALITFWVYNVTADQPVQNCASGATTLLNLTINTLSESAVCAYSEACSGGYCCNKAAEYHGAGIGACQARACTVIPSIINPRNITYSASTTVDFNISLNDAGSACNFTLDSGASTSMTALNSTWFGYTKTGLASGSHTLKVSCNDTDNDFNSTSTLAFGLDLLANVSLISPANATDTTTAAQTFQCNATDPQQINNVTFYLYDSSNSSLVRIASTAAIGTYNQTNFSYTIPYTGTFLWNCKANDTLGNVSWAANNRTITLSATTTTTTTTDTGSGGGGGGGTPAAAGESQTSYTGVISAGSTKEIEYSKEDTLKITSIEIKAAEQIGNAGVKVAESSAGTAGYAISSDEGGTYKYLQITKTLIEDTQIASVKISFKVEKSWYDTNSYDAATTKMRHKVGDAWQDLPTTRYKEDDTYYYFSAESPGLSYFAITAQKKGYVPPAEKKAACGDKVCELDETCSSCVSDCACGTGKECVGNACKETAKPVVPVTPAEAAKKSLLWLGIAVGAVILAVIAWALAKKKKK